MTSKLFVINEWLLEDLLGTNNQTRQEESFRFIEALREKPDRIAVLRGSPWTDKAFKLMKHQDLIIRRLSKYLWLSILYDASKCVWLDRDELKNLPDEVKTQSPEEDLYLVEIYFSVGANALITTDQKLFRALSATSIHVNLRDDFLKDYLEALN